ncbi:MULTISPECIES: XRE family transcriptional regulator [Streptomyces]|uniref:XRE family transcriptional regulator n=1 Tax=Streptomyces TaxID=1883 RepID=UPI0019D2F626|nr:XRE family transcriptional regulator [Streptomyces sp. W1SF4]
MPSDTTTSPSAVAVAVAVPKSAASAERAHADSVRMGISEIARFLQENLGQRLTARIAGISDPKQVGKWASGAAEPRPEAEERLRAALQVFRLIHDAESLHTARAWMIGMNPQLEDEAPAQCIADGRRRDVMVAARAYVDGG